MKSSVLLLVVASICSCRSMPLEEEESVVSVYTTQATTTGTGATLDVYHQIATNIAERITSPIYRFLGYDRKNQTNREHLTTKKPWGKIELLDDPAEEASRTDMKPIDNEIDVERDVEELSVEALKRMDKKPEKISIYNSYLPVHTKGKLELNDTINEISDDDDDLLNFDDDFDGDQNRDTRTDGFTYFLELMASWIQLVWGALEAIFRPNNGSKNIST